MADVKYTTEAFAQLIALPQSIRVRVLKIALRLKDWPDVSGAKPLRGELFGWYRIRTGDYRVRFFVVGDVVTIDRIGHRKDVYDD